MKSAPHEFPSYTRAEWHVDAAIHVLGILAAPIAGLWLLMHASGGVLIASLVVYCIGLVAMLSVSGLYNLLPNIPSREFIRRADHAVIFIMIAGTYTPLVVNRLALEFALPLGAFIWLAAAGGIWLALAHPHSYNRLKLALYLVMGWVGLIVIVPLVAALQDATLFLLLAGALAYSLGSVFHAVAWPRFHNAIWHGLVLFAATLHFLAMTYEFVV